METSHALVERKITLTVTDECNYIRNLQCGPMTLCVRTYINILRRSDEFCAEPADELQQRIDRIQNAHRRHSSYHNYNVHI